MCLIVPAKSNIPKFQRTIKTTKSSIKLTKNFSHGDSSFDESEFILKKDKPKDDISKSPLDIIKSIFN